MERHLRVCIGGLAALLAACGIVEQPGWGSLIGLPGDADRDHHPESDVVVLHESAHVRFLSAEEAGAGYEVRSRIRLKVLTPGGRDVGRVHQVVPWDQELVEVAARSLAGDGRESSARWLPDDGVGWGLASPESGVLYSDTRAAVFDVPRADVGRIVEWETVVRSKSSWNLPWWRFEGPLPSHESRLSVELPAGWELAWGYTEDGEVRPFPPDVEAAAAGGPRVLVWERRNRARVRTERYGLSRAKLSGTMRLALKKGAGVDEMATSASWDDVARHYGRLTQGLFEVPDRALEELDRQPAAPAGEHPAAAAYRFVRDRVRYLASHEGIGAFRPHPAAEVFDVGLGDCKDMATLLIGLLRRRGLQAWPVLVATRSAPVFHPDVPTLGAFDHLIVAVQAPGEEAPTYLDPTAKSYPFGRLPWVDQGQQALLMQDGRGRLVHLPVDRPEDSTEELRLEVQRDGRLSVRVEATGLAAGRWLGKVGTPPDPKRAKRAVRRLVRNAVEQNADDEDVVEAQGGPDAPRFVLSATARVRKALQPRPGVTVVPMPWFFGGLREVRVAKDRRSPVVLGYPRRLVERFVVPLQPGEQVEHAPAAHRTETAAGSYALSVEVREGEVEVVRELVRPGGYLPADRLSDLRRISEEVSHDARSAVVVRGGDGTARAEAR